MSDWYTVRFTGRPPEGKEPIVPVGWDGHLELGGKLMELFGFEYLDDLTLVKRPDPAAEPPAPHGRCLGCRVPFPADGGSGKFGYCVMCRESDPVFHSLLSYDRGGPQLIANHDFESGTEGWVSTPYGGVLIEPSPAPLYLRLWERLRKWWTR